MAQKNRSNARLRRQVRVRITVSGTQQRPRISVFKSLSEIYAQVIDDQAKQTIASASTIDHELRGKMKGLKKSDQAKLVGKALAERARKKGVQAVVFDRGGFKYTGRVKALADGAREGGLEF
jgi:large subunit ribosomal protein L18